MCDLSLKLLADNQVLLPLQEPEILEKNAASGQLNTVLSEKEANLRLQDRTVQHDPVAEGVRPT